MPCEQYAGLVFLLDRAAGRDYIACSVKNNIM